MKIAQIAALFESVPPKHGLDPAYTEVLNALATNGWGSVSNLHCDGDFVHATVQTSAVIGDQCWSTLGPALSS